MSRVERLSWSPASAPDASRSFIAASGPPITTRPVPAMAMLTPHPAASLPPTSAMVALTATIAPGSVSRMARARSYTRPAASDGVHTPASVAAAYSPMLFPSIAIGVTPQSASWRPSA